MLMFRSVLVSSIRMTRQPIAHPSYFTRKIFKTLDQLHLMASHLFKTLKQQTKSALKLSHTEEFSFNSSSREAKICKERKSTCICS